MKKIALLLGIVLSSVSLWAQQEKEVLTLDKALKTALAQNPSVQATALDELAATWKQRESLSGAMPQINASADFKHNFDLPQSFIPAAIFGGPEGTYQQFGAGLKNNMSATVEVNQVIFNQQLFAGIKALEENKNLSKLNTQQAKENVAENVSKLYYSLYTTSEQIAIVQQSLSNVNRLAALAEANYKNGLIRKLDYERVAVNKGSLETQLRNIRTAYDRQANLLKVMMGMPLNTAIAMPDSLPIITDAGNKAAYSSENQISYKILQQQRLLANYNKKSIVAGYTPSLVAFGQYQYAWQHPEFSKIWTDAFHYPISIVGVKLQVPIFDGFQKYSKTKQADLQLRQLDLQSKYLAQSLEADHNNAYAQYSDNLATLTVQNTNKLLAENVYRQTYNEYKAGTVSLTDLLTADNDRQNAQIQYLTAVANVLAAEVAIKKANGTLLSE